MDTFTIERKKFDHTSPFVFAAQLRDRPFRGLATQEPLGFSGLANDGRPIVIAELYGVTLTTHFESGAQEISAEAEQLDLGKGTLEFEPKEQTLHAFLSDTPFALSEVEHIEKRYDGTTLPTFETARPPFEWTTRIGTARLSLTFEPENVSVAGQKSSVRIPRPVVYLTASDSARTVRPADLTGAWLEELEPLLRLLSFLGRNRVSVTRTEVVTVGQQKDPYVVEVYTRWLRGAATSRAYPGPILRPQRMPPGSLNSMLAGLASLPYKDAVLLAISYLVSTYRQGIWIEDSVATAFTALEAVVSGISKMEGSDYIVDDATFEELKDCLKTAIKQFSAPDRITKEQRALVYAKLPELQRTPIVRRAAVIFLRNRIEWADLWPGASDLEKELRDAYERRSQLMHTGQVDDYQAAWRDSRRVHALTERLVYKVIGGEDDWVDSRAYAHV